MARTRATQPPDTLRTNKELALQDLEIEETVARIARGLLAAEAALAGYTPGAVTYRDKGPNDPVTEADRAVNAALRQSLVRDGEGWLSEESVDDGGRLACRKVWVVDPIDGTKEFIRGIPEWAVSVAMVEDRHAVAGGVANVQTGETLVGSVPSGVTLNGALARVTQRRLPGSLVLASRTEIARGEWKPFEQGLFRYTGIGSIAYKLALVACGKADATFTLTPKNEWDVAGGVALVEAAGGRVVDLQGKPLHFNRPDTLYAGLIAGSEAIVDDICELLAGMHDR